MKLVVFSLILLVKASLSAICKNDDYTPLGNGRCYRVFTTLTSATSATSACHLTGGELTSIHSETDNYIIGMWLGGNLVDQAWIGLKCDSLENCYWLDGTPLNYTHFDENPPDLDSGHCFFMKAGMVDIGLYNTWAVGDCDKTKKNFICEEVDQIPTRPPTTAAPSPFPYSRTPDCGWYYEYNGWCYNLGNGQLSEPDAENACQADGGHLVSIHDAFVNGFVYSLVQSSGSSFAWIGLKYLPNSVYVWTDSSRIDYNNIPAALSPSAGSCFAMSNVDQYYPKQWVPNDCSTKLAYVCQRSKSGAPSTVPIQTTVVPDSPCGQTLYGGLSGRIYSPNYPYSFRGAYCYYMINADNSTVNVEIPAIQASGYWVLSVFEGPSADRYFLIDGISSDDFPRIIQRSSGTNIMLIALYSDSMDVGQPFFMTYNSTNVPLYPLGNNSQYTTPFRGFNESTTTKSPINLSCDLHWFLDSQRQMCYSITSPSSFASSMSNCRQQNAELISIHDRNEEIDLYGLLAQAYPNGNFDVWIGGIFSTNTWRWTDSSPFAYTDWIGGASNGTVGSCITASKHGSSSSNQGWSAKDCATYYPAFAIRHLIEAKSMNRLDSWFLKGN